MRLLRGITGACTPAVVDGQRPTLQRHDASLEDSGCGRTRLKKFARLQGKFLSFEIDTRGTVVTCINRIGASVVSRETLDMRLSCGSKITSKIVRRRYYAMCRHAIKMARPGFQDDEVHSNRARNDHA